MACHECTLVDQTGERADTLRDHKANIESELKNVKNAVERHLASEVHNVMSFNLQSHDYDSLFHAVRSQLENMKKQMEAAVQEKDKLNGELNSAKDELRQTKAIYEEHVKGPG